MGVSEKLRKECRASMIHDNMELSRLIVHSPQVEDSCLRKKNREAKKAWSVESGSSKNMFDLQDKPKFKKRFSNQVPSNLFKNFNNKGSNPKSQRGEMLIHQIIHQLVVSVVRNIWVNVLLGLTVAMVMARMAIW